MSEKTTKIVSISMEPSLLVKLDNAAKMVAKFKPDKKASAKANRSAFVCDLIVRFLERKLVPADESKEPSKVVERDADSIPIIIKVPANLKGDREGLQEWLTIKLNAIANALS